MSDTRTISKLAYLLGVSEATLNKYYSDLSFQEMEQNPDAVYLRSLSRVRQTLTKNCRKLDHSIRSLHSMSNIKDDLVIIECRDREYIKFKDIIDICEIVNYTTHSINEILFSTLSSIDGIKAIKDFVCYFEFPIFDKESIGECHDYFINGRLPQGIICPLSQRLNEQQKFSYALVNDEAAVYYAQRLSQYSTLLEDYTTYEPQQKFNLSDEACQHIYVDCDNTRIVDLVSLVTEWQGKGIYPIIHLFLDNRSNFLWHNFQVIFPNIKVKLEYINRIKVQKSVVDMYLSSTILTDILQNNITEFTLFSSDSDYYGLLQYLPKLQKDIHINVVYSNITTNQDYIMVLKSLPYVSPICIKTYDPSIKDMLIHLLTAFSMLRDTGGDWVVDKVCKYIGSILLCAITPDMVNKHLSDIILRPSTEGMIVLTSQFKILSPKEGQYAQVVRLC